MTTTRTTYRGHVVLTQQLIDGTYTVTAPAIGYSAIGRDCREATRRCKRAIDAAMSPATKAVAR